MAQLKIPKSFQLLGHTYKVKVVSKVDKGDDSWGQLDPHKKVLKLRNFYLDEADKEVFIETFFHELIHAILFELEYNKESNNEEFVERVGRGLHQALKTAKY